MKTTCPSESLITQMVSGLLEPNVAASIIHHLDECPSCEDAADRLMAENRLVVGNTGSILERAEQDRAEQIVELIRKGTPIEDTYVDAAVDTIRERTIAPGEQVGEFEIREIIGRGGMGDVYRAIDQTLERDVAIKFMRSSENSVHSRQRFLQEARSAAAINHDHVVPIHSFGEHQGNPFIVMPLLSGEPLSELLHRQKTLAPAKAIDIAAQVAEGLAAAHDKGLLHRDIKPQNIWVGDNGRVRILDFGLARVSGETHGLTKTNQLVGTPKYMAPEQLNGDALDVRCDIFSLGSVLYQMVQGQTPFTRDSLAAILKAIVADAPDALREEIPFELELTINKCLQKSPDHRYQSARELIMALQLIPVSKKRQDIAIGDSPSAPHMHDGDLPSSDRDHAANSETRTIIGVPHNRISTFRWVAYALLAMAMVCSGLAVVFTRKHQVTIKIPAGWEKHVELQIYADERKETQVVVLDKRGNWTAQLHGGEYFLNIKRGSDKFELVDEKLSISRFGLGTIEIELKARTKPTIPSPLPKQSSGPRQLAAPQQPAPPAAVAPFPPATAKQLQQQWADYLGVPVQYQMKLGQGVVLDLMLIPPGEFLMGGSAEEQRQMARLQHDPDHTWVAERIRSTGPQRKVTISEPFYMGRLEVTLGQFRKFVAETKYRTEAETNGKGASGNRKDGWQQDREFRWNGDLGFSQTDEHPVVAISGADARAFCKWLTEESDQLEFRMPTEAQWEYACRAGTNSLWSFGSDVKMLKNFAWHQGNATWRTHPCGERQANPFGMHDLYGNVNEMCADMFGDHAYSKTGTVDPFYSRGGPGHVGRGGSFTTNLCTSAYRDFEAFANYCTGFRVVATIRKTRASCFWYETKETQPTAEVRTIAWQPKGNLVALASHAESEIRIVDSRNWTLKHFFQLQVPRKNLSHLWCEWSPDGDQLAVGYEKDTGFHLISLPNQAQTKVPLPFSLVGNSPLLGGFAWSPDGKRLAVSSCWSIALYDRSGQIVADLKSTRTSRDEPQCGQPKWTANGKAIVFSRWYNPKQLGIVDVANDSQVLVEFDDKLKSFDVHPSLPQLIVAFEDPKTVRGWPELIELPSRQGRKLAGENELVHEATGVGSATWDGTGTKVALVAGDGLHILTVKAEKEATYRVGNCPALCWSPDNRSCIAYSRHHGLIKCELKSRKWSPIRIAGPGDSDQFIAVRSRSDSPIELLSPDEFRTRFTAKAKIK